MDIHRIQLIETAISLASFLLIRFSARWLVRVTVVKSAFKSKEEREVLRLIDLFSTLILIVLVTAIWGVKQSEILLFATSVITVLGVAFFAEMSILSNVTACLVLFFQHPVRIGDHITLFDEAHTIEGELMDITYFFVHIRTADRGTVTVPNSVLLKSPFLIAERGQDK